MPVETLLYGDRKERRAVLLRRAAWGVVAVYLALLLFCSLSLLVMNLSLPLDEIRLSAELANLRLFLVNRIWYPISRLPAALLFYALIALTAIDHTIPTPRRMWVRLLLFLVLFTGAAAVTLPFTLTNGPGSAELWLLAFSGQTTGSLMLLIDLAIWGVRLAQAGSGPIRTGWTGIRNSGLTLPASFSILGNAHSEGKPFTRNGKLDKVAG